MLPSDLPPRIAAKIAVTIGIGCWGWTASTTSDGYGQVWWDGRVALAHRTVYELLVGTIPDGLVCDHLCRFKGCVNPSHLEIVTVSENNRRATTRKPARFCHNGHLFTEATTYTFPSGRRYCRICMRLKTRRYKRSRSV